MTNQTTDNNSLEKRIKITAFNGSHRGKGGLKKVHGGHTHLMVEALLEGAREAGAETENVLLINTKLKRCAGDLKCMLEHPGKCHLQDDMDELRKKYFASDIVLLATPVCGSNVTPLFLSFVTRFFSDLSLQFEKNGDKKYVDPHEPAGWDKVMNDVGARIIDPYYEPEAVGKWRHKQGRQQNYPDIVFVTNAALPEVSQMDCVKNWMRDAVEHHLSSNLIAEVCRTMAEYFSFKGLPGLESTTEKYKVLLRQAGREIVEHRKILPETYEELEKPLIPKDIYMGILNRIHWMRKKGIHPQYMESGKTKAEDAKIYFSAIYKATRKLKS